MWIALPQFVLAPLTATDPSLRRRTASDRLGLRPHRLRLLHGGAAHDQDWIGDDFLPSQIVQAFGQSIGLTSLVWFNLKHLDPSEVLTFGAVLQTGRLFGAEIGAAFVQPSYGCASRCYSNLIGLHVATGSLPHRRAAAGLRPRGGGAFGRPAEADARATALLAHSVQNQANVLAYIDGFMIIGFAVIGVLLLMLLLRSPAPQEE